MKIRSIVLSGMVILCAFRNAAAQPDTVKIKQHAILLADSLLKAVHYQNWSVYADLAPASVIKYYGGKEGYMQKIIAGSKRTTSDLADEDPAELSTQQLLTVDDQWQACIRVSRYIHRGDKKLHVITYFIAQSKDGGETWRLFDVSFNKIANIIYLFPEIFPDMAIEEPAILTQEEELAQQQAATAPAGKKTAKTK